MELSHKCPLCSKRHPCEAWARTMPDKTLVDNHRMFCPTKGTSLLAPANGKARVAKWEV